MVVFLKISQVFLLSISQFFEKRESQRRSKGLVLPSKREQVRLSTESIMKVRVKWTTFLRIWTSGAHDTWNDFGLWGTANGCRQGHKIPVGRFTLVTGYFCPTKPWAHWSTATLVTKQQRSLPLTTYRSKGVRFRQCFEFFEIFHGQLIQVSRWNRIWFGYWWYL